MTGIDFDSAGNRTPDFRMGSLHISDWVTTSNREGMMVEEDVEVEVGLEETIEER